MSWFQILKRDRKRSVSRANAKLVRAATRPIVNEFVEKEIIPRTNKIYFKEILQLIEKKFLPNPEIRKRIKADPALSNFTSQQIGSLLNRSIKQISKMVTYKLANSGYDMKGKGTYYLKEE